MKKNIIFILAGIIILIIGATFLYKFLSKNLPQDMTTSSAQSSSQTESTSESDNAAPDFTVYNYAGDEVKLSDFLGKPVVLNFWASWCGPCRSEMPDFEDVYKELDGEVVFMMVNLTDGAYETKEKGQKHVEEKGYTFPVYFDTDQDAAAKYGISSIPTTLFIDSDGNIVTGAKGVISKESLKKGIDMIKTDES